MTTYNVPELQEVSLVLSDIAYTVDGLLSESPVSERAAHRIMRVIEDEEREALRTFTRAKRYVDYYAAKGERL
tara:strand:+ start:143 stop:361 length:219 start_codon:yes stop_codon:yes gene_type:complete